MPVISKLDKEYKVRDPIHGFVKLDAQEMDIINDPVFQRLRRIRQLSLTEMLYPGANHTRFEHSLGVVQIASEMFDNILSQRYCREMLCVENREDLKRTRKIVRLAALLHDIGHAPFSHAGEGTMPFLPATHYRFKEEKKEENKKRYNHEDYSIEAIKHIFRLYIEKHKFGENLGIGAEDVTALLGDQSAPLKRTSLIWGGLISGQLDADRADYLLRDSHHLGVNYGIYDKQRLVNCITLGRSDESSDCFLAIENGGWHVAESLVIARYQMFSQVYFHKVRRAFDYHVGQATKEVLKNTLEREGFFPPPDTVENLRKYLALDDWDMYSAFKAHQGGRHGEIILKREPYKCKKEWDGELLPEETQKIASDLSVHEGFFDSGAETKWYKLDKDIQIYDSHRERSSPLAYKSKIIETMPGLPKVSRLFINQAREGTNYEYKL